MIASKVCDMDCVRREIHFVDYVRDNRDADVYIWVAVSLAHCISGRHSGESPPSREGKTKQHNRAAKPSEAVDPAYPERKASISCQSFSLCECIAIYLECL